MRIIALGRAATSSSNSASPSVSGFSPSGRSGARTKNASRESGQGPLSRLAAGVVAVQQERDETRAALAQERELLLGDRGAHQRRNGHAKGVQPERRPVALDEHDVLGIAHAMQVEQHPTFSNFFGS